MKSNSWLICSVLATKRHKKLKKEENLFEHFVPLCGVTIQTQKISWCVVEFVAARSINR